MDRPGQGETSATTRLPCWQAVDETPSRRAVAPKLVDNPLSGGGERRVALVVPEGATGTLAQPQVLASAEATMGRGFLRAF
jgi:hypothetical protein